MITMKYYWLLISILTFTATTASGQIALKFGPETFTNTVEGQQVKFVGSGTATVFTPGGAQRMDVDLDLVVDLF